jgi:P-type Ca2+ transporter type 2C
MEAGLTIAEARSLLASVGYNELPRSRQNLFRIAWRALREPMFALLLVATLLYISIGNLGEGLFLSVGALLAVGLVVFQELRSQRALEALKELAQPQVRVVRGGSESRIAARELVPGDLLLIGEGERLAADGLLVGGEMLSVDESGLTGESAPVTKRSALPTDSVTATIVPGDDNSPYLFSGTLIVRGQGVVRVSSTGSRSAMGRIGSSLANIEQQPTPLQKTAAHAVTLLGIWALGFCAMVTLTYGYLQQDWVGGALAGIAVAISLIPEEFPMVLAVFMAMGAWRLASQQVLTRRSAVIETLGGATVLCVDKTGTLTENRMRIAQIWTYANARYADDPPTGESLDLIRIAAMASAVRPVDPMDKAIRELLVASAPTPAANMPGPVRTWPLRPEMPAVVSLWQNSDDTGLAAAKGAPEAICRLCKLSAGESEQVMRTVKKLASQGLRVLGVAESARTQSLEVTLDKMTFDFVGLIGFLDPPRTDVPKAVADAHSAGIRIIMITGDHPETAKAIARVVGILMTDGVCLGSELDDMSDAQLRSIVQGECVFARMRPEQKLRIVEALKANGDIVAMTGDGINDAPALEAAHIGIAMGRRGTDVAREAADLVLLDDGFASIVNGVQLGRRIFTNLRRALIYITAIHIPIAGLALVPVLLGLPPMMFVTHVVLLELAIDPLCALVFENEPSEASAMKRPPRHDEPLFGAQQFGLALVQGTIALAAPLGLYIWLSQRHPVEEARGAAFVALVTTNLALALLDSMSTPGTLLAPNRRVFWIITTGVLSVLVLIFSVPELSVLLRMSFPYGDALLTSAVVTLVGFGLITLVLHYWPGSAIARPAS